MTPPTYMTTPIHTAVRHLPAWQYRILRNIHHTGLAQPPDSPGTPGQPSRVPASDNDYRRCRRLGDTLGVPSEWIDLIDGLVARAQPWNDRQPVPRLSFERALALNRLRTRRGLIEDMLLIDNDRRRRIDAGATELARSGTYATSGPEQEQFRRNLDLRTAVASILADHIGSTQAETTRLNIVLSAQAARNRHLVSAISDHALGSLWHAYAAPRIQDATLDLLSLLLPDSANGTPEPRQPGHV